MRDELAGVKAALEALSNAELQGLIEAAYTVPATAPGFFVWIEAACEWQLHHRGGIDYELQSPSAAIPSEEESISASAAIALREVFANSANVRAFFDAIAELFAGGRTGRVP